MPSINFKGKNSVWNHHFSVPYQILGKDKKLSVKGKNEDENLVIEADNLIALKSLLPKYQGKIKCIYIDPPYNTGKENWVYNDKINSPLIKHWIGKTVGIDDLTRHDKWLCMMAPRLKLLQELLSDDGLIFISIDDNEMHHLRILMDEIFGEKNFVESYIWESTFRPDNSSKIYRENAQYIICFAKNLSQVKRLNGLQKARKGIPSLTKGSMPISTLKFPANIVLAFIPDGRYLPRKTPVGYELLDKIVVKDGKILNDFRLCGRMIWSQDYLDAQIAIGTQIIIKSKDFVPYTKKNKDSELAPTTLIPSEVVGDVLAARAEITALFGDPIFEYPKPTSLITYLMNCLEDKEMIVLDSFAGSGTTAQAVLELNREDKGNRKFILVQLPEKIEKNTPAYKADFRYVHEITRERVKRVINRDKLGVGFSYMKLGSQIDADSILAGTLPSYREFAKYVYYLATGKTMDIYNERLISEKNYFVGKINGETVYLIYKKDKEKLKNLAITFDWAEKINKKDKGNKIVYAPACFLDEEYLEKFNISFVNIPYNLFEKN